MLLSEFLDHSEAGAHLLEVESDRGFLTITGVSCWTFILHDFVWRGPAFLTAHWTLGDHADVSFDVQCSVAGNPIPSLEFLFTLPSAVLPYLVPKVRRYGDHTSGVPQQPKAVITACSSHQHFMQAGFKAVQSAS